MMLRIFHFLLRSMANLCIYPPLRMMLWRLSGVEIGKDSFVNMGLTVIDNYRGKTVKIGERVAIAPQVVLITDSDPNHSILQRIARFNVRGTIAIEDDAWIGAGAIVLPDVHIGKQAVIGAGSVVTSDVQDYAVMAGNPARKIKDTREMTSEKG